MNELQIFNNPEFGKMRSIQIDGEPWFVGKDVAAALGYADTDKAIREHIDDEDKNLIKPAEIAGLKVDSKSAGLNIPNRGMYLINESGVYALIFGSKLDSAKRFKHWVTKEVLPSIRKTGAYSVPKRVIPLMAKQTVAKAQETREEMKALGENPTKILKTVKEIYNKAGYNPPELVLDPQTMTMEDWEDMLDFAYTHKGEVTTYEDYLAYLLIPRLES